MKFYRYLRTAGLAALVMFWATLFVFSNANSAAIQPLEKALVETQSTQEELLVMELRNHRRESTNQAFKRLLRREKILRRRARLKARRSKVM